jgi:hypothetical protein
VFVFFVCCFSGRKSTPTRRQHAMQMATELKQSREVWTAPISKEFSSSESVLFREKFANWGYGPPIQIQQVFDSRTRQCLCLCLCVCVCVRVCVCVCDSV